jgi:hypothetical protein
MSRDTSHFLIVIENKDNKYGMCPYFKLLKSYPDPPSMSFFHGAPFHYAGSRDIPYFRDMYIKRKTFPQGPVAVKAHTGAAYVTGCALLGKQCFFTTVCIGDG